MFSKLKWLTRSAAERTVEGLWNLLGRLLDHFPADESQHTSHTAATPLHFDEKETSSACRSSACLTSQSAARFDDYQEVNERRGDRGGDAERLDETLTLARARHRMRRASPESARLSVSSRKRFRSTITGCVGLTARRTRRQPRFAQPAAGSARPQALGKAGAAPVFLVTLVDRVSQSPRIAPASLIFAGVLLFVGAVSVYDRPPCATHRRGDPQLRKEPGRVVADRI